MSFEEVMDDFLDNMKDLFFQAVMTLLDIFTYPMHVFAKIIETWGSKIGELWYAPILGVGVLIIAWFLIRGFTELEEWIDTTG